MVIRINTVVECMDECSLVGPAYQGSPCTFGIFMGTQQDENCLLFTTDIHWTMEEYLDTCRNRGQPTSKASQRSDDPPACPEAIDTSDSPCFQSAAGESTTEGMRFAVTSCDGQTASHTIDSSADGFDGAACFAASKAYNENADVTDPYMFWDHDPPGDHQPPECHAVDALMDITCGSIVFKGPFAAMQFEDARSPIPIIRPAGCAS